MTGSVNEMSIQLPIVLTDAEAAQIAEKVLYRAWTEREQFEFQLPFEYIELDPGDVVQILLNGHLHNIRIINIDMDLPGVLKMKGVADRASIYNSTVTGGASSYPAQTLQIVPDTIIEILDLPALQDADADTAGYYVAMYGTNTNWTGGIAYKSSDDGTSWGGAASSIVESTMGTCDTALGDYEGYTWDWDNTVDVTIADSGSLSNTTEAAMLDRTQLANAAVIGNEIIQFLNASLQTGTTYRLSGLLRGRKGTEWARAGHASGERFVLLNTSTIQRVGSSYGNVGSTNLFKGVSSGQFIDDVTTEQSVTYDNLNAKPWSVTAITGTRDGSNNLTIDWLRRDRKDGQSMLWNPVMSEDSEQYEVDIMVGTTVVRILHTTTNSVVYSAAQMAVDGITAGDPVSVRIYQLSATIGRGYVKEETI